MKKILSFLVFVFVCLNSFAFGDSLRISLLTVSPGELVYEKFGHTALRVKEINGRFDLVFNYGLFSFEAPNFLYRFVKGETDYQLGISETDYFMTEYAMRGSEVKEQVINMNNQESKLLFNLLQENYKKENRIYRYNFFFDNCSTRPKEIILKSLSNKVSFDSIHESPKSFRDLVYEKTGGYNTWLSFGIDLTLGANTDNKATLEQTMFLPGYLLLHFDKASIVTPSSLEPLVRETITLIPGDNSEKSSTTLFSPLVVCWILFAIFLCFFIYEFYNKKIIKILDTIVFFIVGIAGIIIYYLNFFSLHPSVDRNFNCLWVQPFNLYAAFAIWVKSGKKILYYYHFTNFVVLVILLVVYAFLPQRFNPAFIPLILIITMRSLNHILIGNRNKRHDYKIRYANK